MSDVDPTPDVLADLLVLAAERGGATLVEADRLLRKLAGTDVVQTAHRVWSARMHEAVVRPEAEIPDGSPGPNFDVFQLTRRVRSRSAGARQ